MGTWGITHWIILAVVVLVLFGGRGKISDLMGDVAKGIKSFKKGMAEDDAPAPANPADSKVIDHAAQPAEKAQAKAETKA